MDGQVSGLGTVHPLLTLSFVGTWILPLHVVSSTLKRKSSSSVMDGLQRRRRYIYIWHIYIISNPSECQIFNLFCHVLSSVLEGAILTGICIILMLI